MREDTNEGVIKHSIAFSQGNLSGQVFVELSKGETREIDAFEIFQRWRDAMPEIPGVEYIDICSRVGGPGGGADFTFEFTCPIGV